VVYIIVYERLRRYVSYYGWVVTLHSSQQGCRLEFRPQQILYGMFVNLNGRNMYREMMMMKVIKRSVAMAYYYMEWRSKL